ncbi:MAG: GNAT family N-acetyltransferase [Clostridium sp.]|uniref:GNAT family N-acetyltransferase n=1 Tax=Clostridium sp. TaxID=1506 RepID=UPI0030384644
MNAVVKKVMVDKNKRIIAISDIHGNLNLFKKLLLKVSYSADDILFLVGDLIEKGDQSLNTLRYIMELSKEREVYIVTGNCDTLWEDVKNEIDDENLLRYMLFRKKSILNEMCESLSIEVNEESDIKYIKEQLNLNFSVELNWLMELPHIIETQNFIFAHAGITSEDLQINKADEVIKRDAFMDEGLVFSKYVIVGHWPTANYGKEKGCCNPIINKKQRIISIDGGNSIKSEGQLNALIINGENITFDALDDLPQGEIIKDQEANLNTIQISWMDNAIEVLEEGNEFSLCTHISSNHQLWIRNDRIFKSKDGMRCYDCTDYFVRARKGDVVSIIERTKERTLVKSRGVIGWVLNDYYIRESVPMTLKLEEFTCEEIPELVSWIPDKEFLLQWAGPSYTLELLEKQLEKDIEMTLEEEPKSMMFSAKDDVNKETLGHIQLLGIDKVNMSARIGRVLVSNKSRNKGIGLLMINSILDIAFNDLNLHRVDLGVFDFNKSAIACYKKAGFILEGTFRDCRKMDGKYWSLMNMSILEEEYRNLK